MSGQKIVIGSRGSRLALWQAEWTKGELERRFPGLSVSIKIIRTAGDVIMDAPLSRIGKGVFTKEIENALLREEIDLAVHSLKDLPTKLAEGLEIGAITRREDVRDVFIARTNGMTFGGLPRGATVATGSLRRKSQLLSWRPDLKIVDLRGNLDTRFSKLDSSEWGGMVLARAGVIRLGCGERISEVLPLERVLPAVGQGSLGIQVREKSPLLRYVRELGNSAATISALGERALLRVLEGGCQVPIGAYGRIEQNTFRLDAMIGSLDGKKIVRGAIHGPPEDSEKLGSTLASTLFEGGGREILEKIRSLEIQGEILT